MNKETVGTIIELAVKAASEAIIMLSDHKRERKRQQIEDEIREKREQLNMFTLLDIDNNMYFVRGDNPIAMYKFNGFYVYASTHEILDSAMHKLGLDEFPYENIRIIGGDIMKISADGEIDKSFFEYYDDLWDYYGARGFYSLRNTANKENTTRHNQVIDYARAMGFDENEVELLIDYGFDYTYNMFCNSAERGSQANVDKFTIILNRLTQSYRTIRFCSLKTKKPLKKQAQITIRFAP